ncbi:MAG: hypothetical protein M1838_004448 [Thelocarpon superellum]|nr:MAG: hypothetical protein M1838_004448 [Thelocarpon superellum]
MDRAGADDSGGNANEASDPDENTPPMTGRISLCLPNFKSGMVMHHGDDQFQEDLRRHFVVAENNASEEIVKLKTRLRTSSTVEFWAILMEGMTEIAGAQYAFVAKRILVDDAESAVEMPPIGEPGSCLMGLAFYFNDGNGLTGMFRDYKYLAYGAPCAHMRHDKVFLIPENLNDFVPENVNNFPFPTDAYLGIPLFSEGKCFAHFGLMWTTQAVKDCRLSWGFLELFLHSLEDLVLQRILEGGSFAPDEERQEGVGKVIPKEAVTAAQSLRPYARNLSHELRTPMQGVVGMLDIMYATVQEAVEAEGNHERREVFQTLRENIEVVQDSSRRAVEAADNVVQAYDLNMEVPSTPTASMDDAEPVDRLPLGPPVGHTRRRASSTSRTSPARFNPNKRRRSGSEDWTFTPEAKHRMLERSADGPRDSRLVRSVSPMTQVVEVEDEADVRLPVTPSDAEYRSSIPDFEIAVTPGLRRTNIRELLRYIINESLRVGGRPDSAIPVESEVGESMEIRSRNSKGEAKSILIEWSVDEAVPETVVVDERDLVKLISCVFLNAVKFTEVGKISLTAHPSPRSRFMVISITDTGPGIPQDFLPSMFKPFSREDESLTRQKDGLGLGLLVAKGLVRKIGGDLTCVRSETSGPNHGSEFEIRVPVTPMDAKSSPGTPTSQIAQAPSIPPISLDLDVDEQSRATAAMTRTPSISRDRRTAPLFSNPLRRSSVQKNDFDRQLASKYPATFLVAEDNQINRKLLVTMLTKLGYRDIHEAYDGADAVRQMDATVPRDPPIDIVLMDLWMPTMDGYKATEKILASASAAGADVTVLAVTADVTSEALVRAVKVGMRGLLTKPYKILDLQRLIVEHCSRGARERARGKA